MKHLKLYESLNNIVKTRKDFLLFSRKVIKLLNDEKLSLALAKNGYTINFYNNSGFFTELISSIEIIDYDKINFEMYNKEYDINQLLITFFKNNFDIIKANEYECLFYYSDNLNIEKFEFLISTNKYNL